MKRYSVLRNNQESGPFTLAQLKAVGITETDLVWIEGESTSWKYPTEIKELQTIVEAAPKHPSGTGQKISQTIKSNEGLQPFSQNNDIGYTRSHTKTVDAVDEYFSSTKEDFNWNPKKQRLNLSSITANLFGMGVLLIGVMLCAFVVKKLVDHFEFQPEVASAEAIEITSQNSLVSASTNAAKATNQSLLAPMTLGISAAKTDSTNTGTKKPDKPLVQEAGAGAAVEEPTEKIPAGAQQETQETASSSTSEEKAREEVKETKAEEAPKRTASLSITANDYKVGVFGGISNLELTVSNPSSVAVEKATVEVEFLKPNGSVIKSQTFSVENISAGGSKTLAVPSSSRGVKVRYHATVAAE